MHAIRRVTRTLRAVACVGIVGIGCDSSNATELDTARRLAVIRYYGEPVVLTAPDTVDAGVPFQVSVRSYGGGCVERSGTGVAVDRQVARIRPYDIEVGGSVCTDILRFLDHAATITFTSRGLALIEVHGRREPGAHLLVVTRPVFVR